MYMPHTVTVYTIIEDEATFEVTENITILKGVFVDSVKAINTVMTGSASADAVNLYIPFSVNAVDGITGEAKRFVPPVEYLNRTDKSGVWTLDTKNSFFVKGEVVEPGSGFGGINLRHDSVFEISSVDPKDFGSPEMQHWEVAGH